MTAPESAKKGLSALAEQIQAVREQLFRAIALIECCKYANATLLEVDDPEYIVPVFDVLRDLVDSSAGELEKIADAYEGQK